MTPGRFRGGPVTIFGNLEPIITTGIDCEGTIPAIFRSHVFGTLIVLALLGIGCSGQKPPPVEKARQALEQAAAVGAKRYARERYDEAGAYLKATRLETARQRGRLGPFRNYKTADSLLALALASAGDAAKTAQARIQLLQTQAKADLDNLQEEVDAWREALDGSLLNFSAERRWASASLSLTMCRRLLAQAEYERATETAASGRASLTELTRILEEYENDAAQKRKTWRRWVQETLESSRKSGGPVIVVDKSAHKLYLVKGGRVAHTYTCELGYNSVQQKYLAGDGATPEGQYYITSVRTTGSKYYKALNLNYPNELDKRRFRENKAKGFIASRAHIGGLIEIHGEGGRSKDWTNGCVALTNHDMDQLIAQVSVGTPVTIVRDSDQWP